MSDVMSFHEVSTAILYLKMFRIFRINVSNRFFISVCYQSSVIIRVFVFIVTLYWLLYSPPFMTKKKLWRRWLSFHWFPSTIWYWSSNFITLHTTLYSVIWAICDELKKIIISEMISFFLFATVCRQLFYNWNIIFLSDTNKSFDLLSCKETLY